MCYPPRKSSVLLPNRLVTINNKFWGINGYRPKLKSTSAEELFSLKTTDHLLEHLTFPTGCVQKRICNPNSHGDELKSRKPSPTAYLFCTFNFGQESVELHGFSKQSPTHCLIVVGCLWSGWQVGSTQLGRKINNRIKTMPHCFYWCYRAWNVNATEYQGHKHPWDISI